MSGAESLAIGFTVAVGFVLFIGAMVSIFSDIGDDDKGGKE